MLAPQSTLQLQGASPRPGSANVADSSAVSPDRIVANGVGPAISIGPGAEARTTEGLTLRTRAVVAAAAARPCGSVTVSVPSKSPSSTKVCDASPWSEVEPSPNAQANVSGSWSASHDVVPSKRMGVPSSVSNGPPTTATGAVLGGARTGHGSRDSTYEAAPDGV